MGDGNDEEAVASIRDTGQGIIPRSERGQETEETTRLESVGVSCAGTIVIKIGNPEQQEADVEEEEQEEEGYG